jgi:hypothetical protein
MGLEYITQPQVFLAPITAFGGLQGSTEAYPLLTTYQTWTSTASVPVSVWPIPGTWTMLAEPGSFIITVGGVVQNLSEYSIDNSLRRLIFTTPVSAGVEVVGRQLATAAPSSASFNFFTSVSGRVTNLSAINGNITNLSAVNFNSTNGLIDNLTATNLLVSNLTALSSVLNIVDIAQYEISGFNVQGNASITGTVSALNIILTDNGTLLGATSATSIGVGSLSARTFSLIHEPANDGVDPIFDIGETQTGSFSGFRVRYEEPTNRLIGSSRTGTTVLTSFIITTNTGQVGISGLPASGQALTVSGNISATGNVIGINTDSYFVLNSNRTALGSVTAAYFDPAIALNLLPSRTYFVQYDLYHAKDAQTGGLNYILSSNNIFNSVVANYTHKSDLTALAAPTQLAGVPSRTGPVILLPTITSIAATLSSYTKIRSTIETGSSGNSLVLAVSSAGNIVPLRGSQRIVTLLPQ